MKNLFFIVFIFTTLKLSAVGFIEPALGIKSGSYKNGTPLNIYKDEGFAKGGVLSIRGGYNGDLFFIGAELGIQVLVLEANYASDSNAGYVGVMPGLLAGFHIPVLPIRVWAGIYGSTIATSHEEALLALKWKTTAKGSAFKIGAGFKVLPLMSINIEYCQERFKEVEYELTNTNTNITTTTTSEPDDKPTINSVIVSVSIPIEF